MYEKNKSGGVEGFVLQLTEVNMAKRHVLSNIDIDAKTATCAVCGHTDIYVYPNRHPFCGTISRERTRERYRKNPEEGRKIARRSYQKYKEKYKRENDLLRERVLAAYGHKCECCGEDRKEFLALDHIDGGGQKHRRSLGLSGGTGFHRWLEKNNYPPTIRILCHNCNCALGFYGYCPHEREREKH